MPVQNAQVNYANSKMKRKTANVMDEEPSHDEQHQELVCASLKGQRQVQTKKFLMQC